MGLIARRALRAAKQRKDNQEMENSPGDTRLSEDSAAVFPLVLYSQSDGDASGNWLHTDSSFFAVFHVISSNVSNELPAERSGTLPLESDERYKKIWSLVPYPLLLARSQP